MKAADIRFETPLKWVDEVMDVGVQESRDRMIFSKTLAMTDWRVTPR